MQSEPYVLLVGLSHKNMLATVGAIRQLGYRVRELKSLPPGHRSLSGTVAVEPRSTHRPVPSWLPRRTRKILAAVDESIMLLSRAVFLSPSRGPGAARRRAGYRYQPHLVTVTLDDPPVLPERPLRVMTVTRCRPSKNNAGLLALATRLRDDDVRFTIVLGEDESCPKCGGTGLRDLQKQVGDAGVSNVDLLGPTSDLTDLYRSHHVVIRNSLGEGANVTVIEGAAEGCAVMVSATSGAGQGLFDELGGAIVDAEDLDSQAAFLRGLIADPVLRDRLRKEAMEVVRQRCDPAQFRDLLEGLIARRGPRRT